VTGTKNVIYKEINVYEFLGAVCKLLVQDALP